MKSNRPFIISVAVAGAVLLGWQLTESESTARAMTAYGSENKSMLTVPLDDGMEAVVTLDHVTGDLTGYALNRMTGQFFIRYRRNLNEDFPRHSGKFLVAAALADFRGFQSNTRLANGVIYVSEEGSGKVCAFGMPWAVRFGNSGAPSQELQFIKLDEAATRFLQLR
ncbi:MAG: hypothetical protein AAFX06_29635 [Planctomycetota bacterium]